MVYRGKLHHSFNNLEWQAFIQTYHNPNKGLDLL